MNHSATFRSDFTGRSFVFVALLLIVLGCATAVAPATDSPSTAPTPAREFRAAWVATVANIDWPSEPGLSTAEQQAELRALLDEAVLMHFNAIILQVRPAADALYHSNLEPWSYWLTGEQGKAPEPFYDPLAFAVEEAHRRGLELHAWFNPYRAGHPTHKGSYAASHLSKSQPGIVREYGDLLWLDPGEPEAARHSLNVILDVVKRYDIDGVHLDDYFYPYPIKDEEGRDVPFPDETSWLRAVEQGTNLTRDDWRRQNVDLLVKSLYYEIKREKPWVKFGISPFGIWRPGHPPQITGFDAHDKLYADARKWLQAGWVDYFTPQLYWKISSEGQSYPILLDWWLEQNTHNRHIWPGNYTSRVGFAPDRAWSAEEIIDQIYVTRERAGATGNVHFSMQVLMKNADNLARKLAAGPYAAPALVPASPWLDTTVPGRPTLALERRSGDAVVTMRPAEGERAWLWIVRTRFGDTWTTDIIPGWMQAHVLGQENTAPNEVAVSLVHRTGNESPVVSLPIRP